MFTSNQFDEDDSPIHRPGQFSPRSDHDEDEFCPICGALIELHLCDHDEFWWTEEFLHAED